MDRGWTVHHLWHGQHRTCYVRVGSLNREASPEELARLFRQRGVVRPEHRPVSGTSIADLDRRRLVDYFERVREQEVPGANPSDAWRRKTETWAKGQDEARWRFLAEDREREWRAEAVAYPGTEKDYEARERRTLRGSIVPLKGVDGSVLEPGLVEQAVEFVRRNVETVRLRDGVRREERWDYPVEAVREAVVNAIVHRDYLLSGADVELSLYADRLEIVSPGRLANGVTPDRMRAGCRSARNELLKDVMRDYGYLEHMGMGVPRKIVRGMREHNGTEPDLDEEDERFTVRLWKAAPATLP